MKKIVTIIFTLLMTATTLMAGDFVSRFMGTITEENNTLNNVNIGKKMLDKMSDEIGDKDLAKLFRNLNSIRIITCDNIQDSRFYFNKANEFLKENYADYDEIVSVNDPKNKINTVLKKENNNTDIILISLDEEGKLSIINVSGKIDLESFSKLSNSIYDKNLTSTEDSLTHKE
ncbi:MAG: DUF4252 domain-containing protein [Dysgonamonadaceae bacterium]|jgi:hypothetical protein|nr:DUF4252 domain-containing protein [Dysgonamonadaceae bacterium]MDD3899984.1 DUF4252 domain-containing protein [Dysgonamonadaceae bacterium]MDD4398657.1 DUF4252 domain-containing protein [Dysgonamonadaceae bacterium]